MVSFQHSVSPVVQRCHHPRHVQPLRSFHGQHHQNRGQPPLARGQPPLARVPPDVHIWSSSVRCWTQSWTTQLLISQLTAPRYNHVTFVPPAWRHYRHHELILMTSSWHVTSLIWCCFARRITRRNERRNKTDRWRLVAGSLLCCRGVRLENHCWDSCPRYPIGHRWVGFGFIRRSTFGKLNSADRQMGTNHRFFIVWCHFSAWRHQINISYVWLPTDFQIIHILFPISRMKSQCVLYVA